MTNKSQTITPEPTELDTQEPAEIIPDSEVEIVPEEPAYNNGDVDYAERIAALRQALQVMSPAQAVDWINMLDYGDPGTGKTWLVGTAQDDPRTNPVLVLDVDGGITTLRKRGDLDTIQVRSIDQLEQLYNKLFYSIVPDPVTGQPSMYYKTVAIDTLSELAELDMRLTMKAAYQAKPETVNIDVPSPREWGIVRNHILKIVRGFRDLPCHTIFTSHVHTLQEENQPNKMSPGFNGKLRHEVSGFMDVVGYMYNDTTTGELVRKIQFEGTRRIQAKDRTSALGGSMDNPTITKIWDAIQASNA